MSLIILTKSPKANLLSGETIKPLVKRMLGHVRGPGAVVASLLRGLDELKIKYLYNPDGKNINPEDIVWVNESLDALRWAIAAKQQGKIKALYAGPNLVIAPPESDGIINDPAIDKIIFPSQWTKDFYVSFDPAFLEKIEICPAGVALPKGELLAERDSVIIYDKQSSDPGLIELVKSHLAKKQIKFVEVSYGHFNQNQYFDMLHRAKAMIYLSDSESQGLALQEAWIRDVPTLVWNRGYMEYNNYRWDSEKISAPYLVPSAGDFFQDKNDFESCFFDFWQNLHSFSPSAYALSHLTDVICTKQLLNIINYHE